MRFKKHEKFFRCIHQGAASHYLVGLEFSDTEQAQVDFVIHHHTVGKSDLTDSSDVLPQVMDAIKEKEQEYQRPFYVKTIEFVDNDEVFDIRVYNFAAKNIIDRIINFPEYEGEG